MKNHAMQMKSYTFINVKFTFQIRYLTMQFKKYKIYNLYILQQTYDFIQYINGIKSNIAMFAKRGTNISII